MNPLRVIGAAANVFFLAFLTGSLAKTSIAGTPFSPIVTFIGAVILYGIAIASLIVLFEQLSGKLVIYSTIGSAAALVVFAISALTWAIPQMQQGMVLFTVWAAINFLAVGLNNNAAVVSIRESRRRAVQKRKLDLLRTKNPNEPEKP